MKPLPRFFFYAAIILFGIGTSCWKKRVSPRRAELRVRLPSGQSIPASIPGHPRPTNSFPCAVALCPNGRYLAILNNGFGTEESEYDQSIAILDLQTNKLRDFPDRRLEQHARQTYFMGLAFSHDGKRLYASIASLTDPIGKHPPDTGNGIAVYRFVRGQITPVRFIRLPLAPLPPGHKSIADPDTLPKGTTVPYPAGIAVLAGTNGEKLLVAENLADDAILLDVASGKVLKRFPLQTALIVPAAYPYAVTVTPDGETAFCSLWNASEVAQLNIKTGRVVRRIPLLSPDSSTAPSSHPTAMLLSPKGHYMYVCLANRDRVAVIDLRRHVVAGFLSTELPTEKYGGTSPQAIAQSGDGRSLFVADASANAIAVFDMRKFTQASNTASLPILKAKGFIPTEWYPTSLAVEGDNLFITTGKGNGTGPDSGPLPHAYPENLRTPQAPQRHPYIGTLLHGSVARLSIRRVEARLPRLTKEAERSNLMGSVAPSRHPFQGRRNPIRHVIYIIKENRTYDQVFGDLKPGNGDPSLCLYGWDITPNEHKLARQFGILDNFYCSGEVSENGHEWSMAAITSDYNERTWQIHTRGHERTFDYEGQVLKQVPLHQGIPDIDDPGTGYLWTDAAKHGISLRDYGEFMVTHWCRKGSEIVSPKTGLPSSSRACKETFVRHGQSLPPNIGQPHGSPSPWPWPIPMIVSNEATKPELEGNFDPRFAGFRLDYPDQLRVDEFLDEFNQYVRAREMGHGTLLPQLIILRLGNDHTAGTTPGFPTPAAAVADNDLAVGRVVQAVSHSPYWNDTAIFILEDDAQDGADHVDAHRSTALVISKYSPGSRQKPFVDHHFYTTVSLVHTIEELLRMPPMNDLDAHAPTMASLFSGAGNQAAFTADPINRKNGQIYRMNSRKSPGARESAQMDFTHADRADPQKLNAILWHDRKGDAPMPKSRHIF